MLRINSLIPSDYKHNRPDIDGLRAIAILAVVCFHAFGLRGGFIGVDIFFVISGFLITNIIKSEIENDKFTLANFYAKRIRRIFPALLCVLFTSIFISWVFLFPNEFQLFAKHVFASSIFSSNLFFMHESGYFDLSENTKPLLHLWSLGVEEQFYIFWPIIIFFLLKINKNIALTIFLFLLIGSFGLNIWGGHELGSSFFNPFMRFWELLVGASLTFFNSVKYNKLITRYIRVVGPLLLLVGLVIIDETFLFPGWWALLPTLGGALVILSGPKAWFNRVILSNTGMVSIGLISYPLYLWHWPILVFGELLTQDFHGTSKVIAILLAFFLAFLTYRYVEYPLRAICLSKKFIIVLLALLTSLGILGLMGWLQLLRPLNNDSELLKLSAAFRDFEFLKDTVEMKFNGATLHYLEGGGDVTFFMGDSHIEQYGPRVVALKKTIKNQKIDMNTIYWGTRGSCLPISNVYQDVDKACPIIRDASFKFISSNEVKTVVIGACWNCYFSKGLQEKKGDDTDHYFSNNGVKEYLFTQRGRDFALNELEKELTKLALTKKVYLLLDNPNSKEANPLNFMRKKRFNSSPPLNYENYLLPMSDGELQIRMRLLEIANRAQVQIISPLASLCQGSSCAGVTAKGEFIYSDENHLRPFFVKENADYIDLALNLH